MKSFRLLLLTLIFTSFVSPTNYICLNTMSDYIKYMATRTSINNRLHLLDYEGLQLKDIEYLLLISLDEGDLTLRRHIATHSLVNIEFMLSHPEIQWDDPWLDTLYNANITTQIIRDYSQFNWNWSRMTDLKHIDMDFILENIDKEWNWEELSRHHSITMHDIITHPNLNWDFYNVSSNPNVTIEDAIKYPDFDWNYYVLIDKCKNVLQFIQTHPEFKKFVNPKIIYEYKNKYKTILNPNYITNEDLRCLTIEEINDRVARFYSTVNVVLEKINLDKVSNHGINALICEYL